VVLRVVNLTWAFSVDLARQSGNAPGADTKWMGEMGSPFDKPIFCIGFLPFLRLFVRSD